MIRKIVYTLFFIVIVFSGRIAHADLAPTNAHPVKTCVIIENSNNYENIYLFNRVSPPGFKGFNNKDTYEPIEFNKCLKSVYKFSSYSIWWGSQNNTSDLHLLSDKISPNDVWISNNDVLLQQTVTYSLNKSSDGNLIIEKTRTAKIPETYIQYLFPLLLTIVIELIALLVFLKQIKKTGNKFKNAAILLVILNLITFTPFWLLTSTAGANLTNIILISEIIIIIVEAIGYKIFLRIGIRKSLFLSTVLNLCSIFAGLFTYLIAQWLFK